MMNIKLINEMLADYLEDTELEDFELVKNFNDIILKNTFFSKEIDYKYKIKLNYAVNLSYSFLKSISNDYASYFEKRLNDGTILFSEKFEIGESYYDLKSCKRVIHIPITKSIEDSYVMVHEILHDMNLTETFDSGCRVLVTEAISILGELLFRDFLIEHNLSKLDGRKVIFNNFYSIYKMACLTDLEFNIIDEYFKVGYISMNFLKSTFSNYDDDVIDHFVLNEKLELDYNQRYIIGILLACYIYDRIKNRPKLVGEFMDINSIMNNVYFEDIMSYLNFEMRDNDTYVLLTDKSLKEVEKTYKKTLKEL